MKTKIEKVRFNEKRALEIFPILADLWERREGIFKGERLPQELWNIYGDDKAVAHWLFYAAQPMRGGLVSEDPFKWLSRLRERFPSTFDPKSVVQFWPPANLKEALQTVTGEIMNGQVNKKSKGVGSLGFKLEELAKHWYHNSQIIADNWDGNVLNIFKDVGDFEEAFGRIDWRRMNGTGIRGMRRKIFSLFTIWLQEKDLVPHFPTPIPIDFHALRTLWATGVIDIETKPLAEKDRYPKMLHGFPSAGINETITDAVAIWSQKFLTKHELSHMAINPAVWVLSRRLCAEHFQNISKDAGKTFVLPEELKRKPQMWPKHYRNPCGICPIERYCTKVMPAAIYYDVGILVPMERIPYHQDLLPGIDWQHHIIPKSRKGRSKGNN